MHKGKQYVAVQVGLGGVNQARMRDKLVNVPRGGSVWAFALSERSAFDLRTFPADRKTASCTP